MSRLASLQSYIAISLLASPLYDSLFYDVTLSPDKWVYRSLLFVTTVSAGYLVSVPNDEFRLYRDLAKACHQVTGIRDFSSLFEFKLGDRDWFGIGLVIGVGLPLIATAAFRLCQVEGNLVMPFVRKIIPYFIRKYCHYCHKLIILNMAMLYAVLLIYCNVDLSELRESLKRWNPGQESQHDKEWEYGQTAAVLRWAPMLWACIKAARGTLPSFMSRCSLVTWDCLVSLAAGHTAPDTMGGELQQQPAPPPHPHIIQLENRTPTPPPPYPALRQETQRETQMPLTLVSSTTSP